jgi:hypothetical protein
MLSKGCRMLSQGCRMPSQEDVGRMPSKDEMNRCIKKCTQEGT